MSGLVTVERLLKLFTGQAQHGELAAERLAGLVGGLEDQPQEDGTASPQVQLLWRIAGYLYRNTWECRVAAGMALERVGCSMAWHGLLHSLVGPREGCMGLGGLLTLETLDIARVLRDAEVLQASGGEEYTMSNRGPVSREELEAQKAAIVKRLGLLQANDATTRTAYEVGGVEGLGIGDGDLEAAQKRPEDDRQKSKRGRKRGLLEVTGGGGASSEAGQKGGGAKASGPKKHDEEGRDVAPRVWLAEQLGVRLFDAKWEHRHGAALGLLGLAKAYRAAVTGQGTAGGVATPWFRRWAEDLVCRCVCVLSLDRFADYSLGNTVAPVREVAAQLLALLLAIDDAHDDPTEPPLPSPKQQKRKLDQHKAACQGGGGSALAAGVISKLEVLCAQEGLWEVRHGAFVALKYLVALPAKFLDSAAPRLVSLGLLGLGDSMDDVKDAAATTLLSILTRRAPAYGGARAGEARELGSEREAMWTGVLRLLMEVEETSVHVKSLLALALRLGEQGGQPPQLTTGGKPSPGREGKGAVCAKQVVEHLWRVGMEGDEGVRSMALRLLNALYRPLNPTVHGLESTAASDEWGKELLGLAPGLRWRVFEALCTVTAPSHVVTSLMELWEALPSSGDTIVPPTLRRRMLHHLYATDLHQTYEDRGLVNGKGEAVQCGGEPWAGGEGCGLCGLQGRTFGFTARRQAARAVAILATQRLQRGEGEAGVLDRALEGLRRSWWAIGKEVVALVLGEYLREARQGGQAVWDKEAEAREALLSVVEGGGAQESLEEGELWGYRELDRLLTACGVSAGVEQGGDVQRLRAGDTEGPAAAELWQSFEGLRRRVSTAAAAALALARDPLPPRLATVIRALMEGVKGEGEGPRAGLAVQGIAGLIQRVATGGEGSKKGRKACDKALGNLCVLSCVFKDDDPQVGAARNAAREALRQVAEQLGGETLELLPCLWERIGMPIEGAAGEQEAETLGVLENGARLLLVLLPHLVGPSLDRALSLHPHLYQRAIGEGEGPLINRLAARCLALMLKKQGHSLAAELGTRLEGVLGHAGGEGRGLVRASAAHVLLELAKAVRATGWEAGGEKEEKGKAMGARGKAESGAYACVPHLLPPALAIVADQDPEVRGPGGEAFRLLVELAPLLPRSVWHRAREQPSSRSPKAGKGQPVPPSVASSYDDVIRLVLGESLAPAPLPDALLSLLQGGVVLRGYQAQGIRWLNLLAQAGLNGALCDDMGLGKTLQTLAAIALRRLQLGTQDGLAVVVCPSSLCGHWEEEARRFFGPQTMAPIVFRPGLSKADRAALLTQEKLPRGHGLLIISYTLLRREVSLLESLPWVYAIFDEGHVLRNPRSAVCRAAHRLHARHRVVLSGTPVQNHVHELYTLFDLLMPGLLGPSARDFGREYGRPIGKATLASASADVTAHAIVKLEQLQAHLLPFILRRDKASVLRELPPKVIMDVGCTLSSLQRRMYDGHCAHHDAQSVLQELRALAGQAARLSAASPLADGDGLLKRLGTQALRLLHHLRLLCVHPALVLDKNTPETASARERLLRLPQCSGKMMALQSLLHSCGVFVGAQEEEDDDDEKGDDIQEQAEEEDEVEMEEDDEEGGEKKEAENSKADEVAQASESAKERDMGGEAALVDGRLHRCLIFAQHRDTLDAIEQSLLRNAPWNPGYGPMGEGAVRYLRLDGHVPSNRRQELVNRFNADRGVALMLLTTRVGGLGLNLTGADVVVFVEHDWNPQVDLQAMDRAHRLGQQRSVSVYRLVTSGTVEEQILSLQARKKRVADAVVVSEDGGEGKALDTRMARVLDVVSASLGQGSTQDRGPQGTSSLVESLGGGEGAPAGLPAMLPTEEVWGEEQYSSFEVEAFLANVLGLGS